MTSPLFFTPPLLLNQYTNVRSCVFWLCYFECQMSFGSSRPHVCSRFTQRFNLNAAAAAALQNEKVCFCALLLCLRCHTMFMWNQNVLGNTTLCLYMITPHACYSTPGRVFFVFFSCGWTVCSLCSLFSGNNSTFDNILECVLSQVATDKPLFPVKCIIYLVKCRNVNRFVVWQLGKREDESLQMDLRLRDFFLMFKTEVVANQLFATC